MDWVGGIAARARALWRDEAGQTLSEYALIVALLCTSLVGVTIALSQTIREIMWEMVDGMAKDVSTELPGQGG